MLGMETGTNRKHQYSNNIEEHSLYKLWSSSKLGSLAGRTSRNYWQDPLQQDSALGNNGNNLLQNRIFRIHASLHMISMIQHLDKSLPNTKCKLYLCKKCNEKNHQYKVYRHYCSMNILLNMKNNNLSYYRQSNLLHKECKLLYLRNSLDSKSSRAHYYHM